jgi:hypothetical protein
MRKTETSVDSRDLPVWRYRLSDSVIARMGEEVCKKGIMFPQGIMLYSHFITSKTKLHPLNQMLVSETNKDGMVFYEKMIPTSKEVLETNILI